MDVIQDKGSTEFEHSLVLLENASDILRFSFVAQNSIYPLDLSQQDGFYCFDCCFPYEFQTSSILDSTIQYPNFIVNTEEKCRKTLSNTRHIMYRLHLDLPEKRECSLKDGPKPDNMRRNSFFHHIEKIDVHPNFYFTVLASLAKEAVKRSDKKIKIIKWFVTFNAVKENCLDNKQAYFFAKFLNPEVTDSAFLKAFLKKSDLRKWMIRRDRPEMMEYFLYHLRQSGGSLNDNTQSCDSIELCIGNMRFLNISSVLKYQDAPRVPTQDIVWAVYSRFFDSEFLIGEKLLAVEKWMSPRRFYLMMQVLFIYFRSPTASGAECLRLLWNTIPDAFFSLEEIEMALETGLSSETIRELYNFYSGAVGVYHAKTEPRSLKHLSRPVVRRMLFEGGCWIPDGIKQICVPRELQSFLNLED